VHASRVASQTKTPFRSREGSEIGMRSESKSKELALPRWESSLHPGKRHHRPIRSLNFTAKDSSKSVSARTRKTVNYACVGRSQRKLWWRLVEILTCKSFFERGYRGERLIEPSSSWFPPKFPSG
jgi:hypothetical protein